MIDEKIVEHILNGCIGWRRLFEQAQDVISEVLKFSAHDIPDDVYLKCLKIRNIHELPKRYLKGEKNG